MENKITRDISKLVKDVSFGSVLVRVQKCAVVSMSQENSYKFGVDSDVCCCKDKQVDIISCVVKLIQRMGSGEICMKIQNGKIVSVSQRNDYSLMELGDIINKYKLIEAS